MLEVTEVNSASQPIRGQDSLRALCLAKVDPKASCDLMLENHPELLAAFVMETFNQDSDIVSIAIIFSLDFDYHSF